MTQTSETLMTILALIPSLSSIAAAEPGGSMTHGHRERMVSDRLISHETLTQDAQLTLEDITDKGGRFYARIQFDPLELFSLDLLAQSLADHVSRDQIKSRLAPGNPGIAYDAHLAELPASVSPPEPGQVGALAWSDLALETGARASIVEIEFVNFASGRVIFTHCVQRLTLTATIGGGSQDWASRELRGVGLEPDRCGFPHRVLNIDWNIDSKFCQSDS